MQHAGQPRRADRALCNHAAMSTRTQLEGSRVFLRCWGMWDGGTVGLPHTQDLSQTERVGLLRSLGTSADLVLPVVCYRQDSPEWLNQGWWKIGEPRNKAFLVSNPSCAVGKLRVRRPLLRVCILGSKSPTFTGDAVGGTPVKNHPLEERVVIYILLGPRGAQTASAAAFLLAQLCLVQDLAAAVLCLAEPAISSCEEAEVGRWVSKRQGREGKGGSQRAKEGDRGGDGE